MRSPSSSELQRSAANCASCGRQLTDEEREYYGSSCESCEGEAWALVDLADDGKLPVGDGFDWRPAREIGC